MTVAELIVDFRQRDIQLSANGDKLKVDAPKGALTQELVAMIKTHKAELLQLLAPEPEGCAWREENVRLIFSDGAVYGLTESGGWILTRHPNKQMREPGTIAMTP